MGEFLDTGVGNYSYAKFSEPISKHARHLLTLICLKGIEREYQDTPLSNKSRGRGRPQKYTTLLAHELSVSKKTVERWANPEDIHSNDENAGKLAEAAYRYDHEKTIEVLMGDVERYRRNIEAWLRWAQKNIGTHPCPEYPENDVNHVISMPNTVSPDLSSEDAQAIVICNSCGQEVPRTQVCIVCGSLLFADKEG